MSKPSKPKVSQCHPEKLSLSPLTPEQALFAAMNTRLPKQPGRSATKAAGKKPKSSR